MPKLVVNPGTKQARVIELTPGVYNVGRSAGNDIRIEDPSVSTTHARILVQAGKVVIRDAGSTNGTFINGAPVKQGEIQPGQSLRLGWVEMTLMREPTAATLVAGIPIPNPIAAEALEAARRRRFGGNPQA
jgi:pSer/pThr/pTyr-binding forkhead associated (FHA) protein